MSKFKNMVLSATMALATVAMNSGVLAIELEVTHWWTSEGEAAAVKVFADAFNSGGDEWVDGAIEGSGGVARPIIVTRIKNGDPMGATQLNHGLWAEELIEKGLMLDLTALVEREGWKDIVRPPKLLDSCTRNGKVYCVPVNIHSWQWMWISLIAYRKAGIDPPTDWNSFVSSAPRLRDAGIIPLAVGDQAWQINGMFGVIQVGLGGKSLWVKTMVERNSAALRGDKMALVWEEFGKARAMQAKSKSLKNWSDATSKLITGQAGAQIMGDWAQGEFSYAEYTAGEEYDCLPGLGIAPVLDTAGDAFYFPRFDDPDITAAQLRMASMMLSKKVQVGFNLKKGSLPVRADIDLRAANDCMKKGLAILKNPDNIMPSGDQVISSEASRKLNELVTAFWNNLEMTPEDAHATWAELIEGSD